MSYVAVVARWIRTLPALVMLVVGFLVVTGAPAAVAAPVPPQDITVTADSSLMNISWTSPAVEGEASFSVWRAIQAGDVSLSARIVGFSGTTTFIDSTAVVGARYRYAVVELGDGAVSPEALSFTGIHSLVPADPVASLSPHRTEGSTALDITCARCHSLSDATSEVGLLIDHNGPYVSQAVLCTRCHAHTSVSDAFAEGLSGHTIAFDADPVPGGTGLTCSQCHDPHGMTNNGNALAPERLRRPEGVRVDVVWTDPVTGEYRPNALCFACHDLPTTTADFRPVFDPLYYPVSGTYPGAATYADPARNAHAALTGPGVESGPIAVSPGSCTHCHGPHRTDSPNDGLIGLGEGALQVPNTAPGDVAPLCARCHAWVMPSTEVTDTASWGVHPVSTPGGVFEPGTSIPCYMCHNAHGSSRGNAFNISDALGANLDPATAEREFCFTCHTTSQGLGWDSDVQAYVAPEVDEILGFSRTALEPGGVTGVVSRLRLKSFVDGPTTSDPHSSDYIGNATCGTCHGTSHHPAPADIAEINCYSCHAELLPMERTTASRADSYHHILGDGVTINVGGTPLASVYEPPTAANGFRKYCLTCHTGHTTLATAETNLKTSPTDPTPAPSDFLGSSSTPGICLSCHQSAQVRNLREPADQRKAFVRVPSGAEVNTVRAVSAAD